MLILGTSFVFGGCVDDSGDTCKQGTYENDGVCVAASNVWSQAITVTSEVDILFVIDNSRSMAGEQRAIAESFSSFTKLLSEKYGEGKYRIAVVTTGVESTGCGPCPADQPHVYSCTNATGENGRFQDRLGKNNGDAVSPDYVFATDATCRVMDSGNIERCFYDQADQKGVAFVGINGCGYEKGLAPIRAALQDQLLGTWNSNFLRPDATLAVVVITDEEDCGEVGDITESVQGISGRSCYYAAKGVAPDGSLSDPEIGLLYQLTPVGEYYNFLVALKDGNASMVRFAAIVGVEDPANPSATQITYDGQEISSRINTVCETPECVDNCDPNEGNYESCADYCRARPGTRYVELATMFGLGKNGFVDTICQQSFSDTLAKMGNFVGCPDEFSVSESLSDTGNYAVTINERIVPRYSCTNSEPEVPIKCAGTDDGAACSGGTCVETWSYVPAEILDPAGADAVGGVLSFAQHHNPCKWVGAGETRIELVRLTD